MGERILRREGEPFEDDDMTIQIERSLDEGREFLDTHRATIRGAAVVMIADDGNGGAITIAATSGYHRPVLIAILRTAVELAGEGTEAASVLRFLYDAARTVEDDDGV